MFLMDHILAIFIEAHLHVVTISDELFSILVIGFRDDV